MPPSFASIFSNFSSGIGNTKEEEEVFWQSRREIIDLLLASEACVLMATEEAIKASKGDADRLAILQHACVNGIMNKAFCLCKAGVQVKQTRVESFPLLAACLFDNTEVATMLIRLFGAVANPLPPETAVSFANTYSIGKYTADQVKRLKVAPNYTPLLAALEHKHFELAELLLLQNDANVHVKNQLGSTPLTFAAGGGSVKLTGQILDRGSDVDTKIDDGATSLLIASQNGHLEVVKLLLERGAKVNEARNDGNCPLNFACLKGHANIARLLADSGADINYLLPKSGNSVLYHACEKGNEEIVSLLLELGADLHRRSNKNWTCLIRAAEFGHANICQLLLQAGAEVDAETEIGSTALTWASQNGHTDVAKVLLRYNCNLHALYFKTCSSLFSACFHGRPEMVELLIEAGASCNIGTPAIIGACKEKPSMDLVRLGGPNLTLEQFWNKRKCIVRTLIDRCPDLDLDVVDMRVEEMPTPLMLATREKQKDIVLMLEEEILHRRSKKTKNSEEVEHQSSAGGGDDGGGR